MIDTIKIKVKVSEKTLTKIKSLSSEVNKLNHFDDSKAFNYFTCNVHLPSYFRGVNIFHDSYKDNVVFFELSIPKFLYGHNLYMVNATDTIKALNDLRSIFVSAFDDFPSVDIWEVTRIDLCYNWSLGTYGHANSLLGIIRSFEYPRRKSWNYPSSIYSHSQISTVKWYLKFDEFRAHDLRYIRKYSMDEAERLLRLSADILRFEVELRSRAIKEEFDKVKPLVHNILKEDKILYILNKFFARSMNQQSTVISSNYDNYLRLLRYSKSPTKAIQLYQVYRLLHSDIKEDRDFLIKTYSRMTIYRYKKAFQKSGVGLSSADSFKNFSFTIPSKNTPHYLIPSDRASDSERS